MQKTIYATRLYRDAAEDVPTVQEPLGQIMLRPFVFSRVGMARDYKSTCIETPTLANTEHRARVGHPFQLGFSDQGWGTRCSRFSQ